MKLLDVNILVYAHRQDSSFHQQVGPWLGALINSDEEFATSDLILSGFLRIVTLPDAYDPPSETHQAIEFVDAIRSQPNHSSLSPGRRHWDIFLDLCRVARVRGNMFPDAYHAALAIEFNCEWITMDRGFGRYPGLKWSSLVGSG